MHVKTCAGCGKEFPTKTRRRFYCDGPCFRAHEAEEGRARVARHTTERRRTYTIVQSALVRGVLVRRPCETCGSRRYVEAHHDDYARPLDVRWLCKRHHRQHHVQFGPGKNAFCEEISA